MWKSRSTGERFPHEIQHFKCSAELVCDTIGWSLHKYLVYCCVYAFFIFYVNGREFLLNSWDPFVYIFELVHEKFTLISYTQNSCMCAYIRPKKKLLCCPLPTDRKMRKNRVVFFFFFFLCQIWAKNLLKFVFNGLKKHLYMRFDCIPPEFSPFRNLKKNIGKLNSLT